MKNKDKIKCVEKVFPVCVHSLELKMSENDLFVKTINCNFYKSNQRILGKFYKPISYKWRK
jgi:hypothetical protein